MAVVLALTAAASWGASDFLGGLVGRRSEGDRTVAISFITQVIGLVALLAILLVLRRPLASGADLGFGAAAGIGGALGIGALYRGLAVGRMAVVAPVAGATGAAIPVVVGAAGGGNPAPLAWAGVMAALVAIVLVSLTPEPDGGDGAASGGLVEGLLAGLGFAGVFVLLDRTTADAGLWPLVSMRTVAGVALALAGLAGRRTLRPPSGAWPMLAAIGALDMTATVTYLSAAHRGLLAIVAVVGSLYPVGTVVLARFVLHERTTRHQIVGLVLAMTGVALIALG